MKRGQKETIAALAVGGGLLAIIMAAETRNARRGAPVIVHGPGRGRWARPSAAPFNLGVGFDLFDSIGDITESIADAVASALIDESDGQLSEGDRPSVIAVVLNAMKRYQPPGAQAR